ncbi:Zinc finger (C3HC4-type RING finger) family protein [Zea mays]|uniref:Zinc finger (C3HC4-type RING finger) family protein n=1 Tax=Zea mays TaxID=4577 RepID=A0A1D6LGC6_MAIZE|nr:Zinc finger (C3HC4-type RING finger) family protein [Zea mays]
MTLEKVRVSIATNPHILLIDSAHTFTLNGKAVVRVEAPSSMKNHAPIDLVTLININQSMSWPAASQTEIPSRLDLLKNAMKFIIRQLGDDDRLAIVAFNDKVIKENTTGILEISGSGRMAIEKKVDGLVAMGDTAFKPSLEHAVKLLDDRADKKRAGFIVLISDGLDGQSKWGDESITPTDPIRGLLRKYPVHTFGLGKAHDPKALHYIADISYGIYSSIVTDNLDKIIEAFAVCLAGFKTVVAVDACVDIWSNSLLITRIDPGGYILRGSSGGILVGTLYAGEVKDFIVYFSYRTGSWSGGYYTILNGINARVTYREAPGRQSTTTDTCSVSLPIHVANSSSPPANPCPPYPMVLQQMVRLKVLDLLISVLKEFLVLKGEAASAVHGKEGGDDPVLQAIAASLLQRKWKEFKQSDESWKEAPRNFVNLGGIDEDISAMVGILKRGLGVGCIHSWLSSNQMQRATATGGLPGAHMVATGQFRTPAMNAMVQEAHRHLAREASAHDAGTSIVCKRAVELLDGINKRFDLWCKLDQELPRTNQPSPHQEEGHESRDLTAVLRGDINRARQHDIYLMHSGFILDAGCRSRDQAMAQLPHIRGEDAWPRAYMMRPLATTTA